MEHVVPAVLLQHVVLLLAPTVAHGDITEPTVILLSIGASARTGLLSLELTVKNMCLEKYTAQVAMPGTGGRGAPATHAQRVVRELTKVQPVIT